MRKLVLTLGCLFLFFGASAQKGALLLSGSIDYQHIKWDDTKTNTFAFSPSLEYMLSEVWSVSAGLSVASSKQYASVKDFTMGPTLGATRYFPLTDNLSISLGGSLVAGWGTYRDVGGFSYNKSVYQTAISYGLVYCVSPKLYIFTNLGALSYGSETLVLKDDSSFNSTKSTFDFNVMSRSVSVGLQVRLCK